MITKYPVYMNDKTYSVDIHKRKEVDNTYATKNYKFVATWSVNVYEVKQKLDKEVELMVYSTTINPSNAYYDICVNQEWTLLVKSIFANHHEEIRKKEEEQVYSDMRLKELESWDGIISID